ncbi:MAG: hypothetical protein AMS25_01235 [Gemmatimonas sp. SM23_52]|nr:MAG: hypothetical protein AMS25_01235 [Gemmatimonas sp. SM23_52]
MLATTACFPKQPQFAPEQVITHFEIPASVQEVADAAAMSLRWLGFRAWKLPTRGGVIVRGWHHHSHPYASSGDFRTSARVAGGAEGYFEELTAVAVWCVTRRFEITALALGDRTLVIIEPHRYSCERELPLGKGEVQLTQMLTRGIKKRVGAERR